MPSGAKKRKAAKKKKEKGTEINTNPSTTNLQGTVFHPTLLNFMHAKHTLFNFFIFLVNFGQMGTFKLSFFS